MIEAIAAMSSALSDLASLAGSVVAPSPAPVVPDGPSVDGAAAPSYTEALHNALGELDNTVSGANATAKAFSAGDQSIPLSDVMVSLEQANLAMQMASGVRDKVVVAYSNIMNMQV
jgi:flagellar hook-basal body complex protein FliE